MLVPAEAILCVSHREALKMELPEEALAGEAVGLAKDVLGAIALVAAALDQAVSTERREAVGA